MLINFRNRVKLTKQAKSTTRFEHYGVTVSHCQKTLFIVVMNQHINGRPSVSKPEEDAEQWSQELLSPLLRREGILSLKMLVSHAINNTSCFLF